jgi:hypothetical protein
VSPVNTGVTPSRCRCGSRLAWDSRTTYAGTRPLALCVNPDCGIITTPSAPGSESTLQSALLGDRPAVRYLQPWLRFYFRTTSQGFRWRAHAEGCRDCASELVAALDIPWRGDRGADPWHVSLCLDCGATETSFWIERERVSLWTPGTDWTEPSVPLQALKRALTERSNESDGYAWGLG